MHGALLTGLVLGLILAVITSPAFFALINITSTKGLEAGGMFVSGLFTSSLFFLLVALLGFDLIEYEFQTQRVLLITTAILLFLISIIILFNYERKLTSKKIIYIKATNPLSIFLKGFLLNISNPVIIILWLGLFNLFFILIEGDKDDFILFFSGVIVTVLIFDLLKLFSANIFSNKINPLYLLFFNKIIAVIIITFIVAYIL